MRCLLASHTDAGTPDSPDTPTVEGRYTGTREVAGESLPVVLSIQRTEDTFQVDIAGADACLSEELDVTDQGGSWHLTSSRDCAGAKRSICR